MDNIKGRIIRGISGFYYVYTEDGREISTHARGINRYRNEKPLVGDEVLISITHEEEGEGSIDEILPRKSELIRPAVSNADMALIVMSLSNPKANTNLLDRFLIQMEWQDMPCTICFNKSDIAEKEEIEALLHTYQNIPYKTLVVSAKTGEGTDKLRELLKGKITVVAGQSGAGKSTLVNSLQDEIVMETGEISKKLGRGKHTTRRAELIPIGADSFIVDTPGFSSIDMRDITEDEIQDYFPEIREVYPECKFRGCAHINEPGCKVKMLLEDGIIDSGRYESYIMLYNECKSRKKY